MFELNGKEYSLEQVEAAALASNISLDEYITEAGLKAIEPGKITPTVPGAAVEETVVPEQPNMELDSVDTSLELDSDKYDILSDYIAELSKAQKEKPEEPFTYKGALVEMVLNIPLDWQAAWESTKTFALDFIKETAGSDAADLFFADKNIKGAIAYIDPKTLNKVTFEDNPERFKELSALDRRTDIKIETVYDDTDIKVGEAAEKYIINKFEEIKSLKSQRLETGRIVKKFDITDPFNVEFASGPELFSGITNVVGSLISTMIPAVLTRGASIGPQITAPMYIDYNTQKAKRLYGDDPDAIKKLIQNNETDASTPLALGALAAGFEYAGFKGITKQIASKAGRLKPLVSLLGTQNKEGRTEVIQTGLETVNASLAEGKSLNDAIVDGLNTMASADGLESYLGGFIGSGVIAGPSSVAKSLRSDEGSIKTVMDHIDAIGALQKQRSLNKDKSYRSAIDLQIQNVEKSLKTFLEDAYIKTSLLSKEQRAELEGLIKQKEQNQNKLKDLEASYNLNKITGRQYGLAKGIISNQNKAVSNNIVKIKNSIELDKTEQGIAAREEMLKKAQEQKIVPDLNIKSFDKQADLEDYVAKTRGAKKFDGRYGVIYQNPDTNQQEILINKQLKIKDKVITTADHEFLHAVLFQTVKNNPQAQINIGKALNNELIKQRGLDEIAGTEYFSRLNSYLSKAETEQEIGTAWEEALTLYSEGLSTGAFKAPSKSFIEKIKEFLQNLFGGNITKDIRFDTGNDVIQFVQSYNKSFESGKWGEDIRKAAREGIKGELVSAPTTPSAPTVKESKADLKSVFDKFVQTPEGTKKYKNLTEFQNSTDYIEAYDEVSDGKAIGTYVRGLVNKDPNLGALDESIKSEIISNVRENITERFIKNFDPAKNESLFGYLFGAQPIVDFALRDVKKKYAQQVKTVSTDMPTEGRQFEAVDIEAASIEDIVDRSFNEEQQAFESFLKTNLTVDGNKFISSELAQEIRTAAYETFEGDLPAIDSRDFRKFVTDSYKKKLMPIVKKALGNKKKLASFVVENKQDLLEGLPISYWVQIERVLPVEQKIFTKYVKRLTTQAEIDKYTELGRVYTENDADGPELYDLLRPSDEKIQAFFTGPVGDKAMRDILGYDVAGSTLAARKSELGANIGLQAAFDATPGLVKQKDYTEQEVAKIALKVNRDARQKFSEKAGQKVKVIDSKKLISLISDGLVDSDIAKELNVPEQYIEFIREYLEDAFPPNVNKVYGQEQIEYINTNQFNKISEEAGLALVAGKFPLNLVNKKGELTPNGKKYVENQVSFALDYINNATNENGKIRNFENFIRFESRNMRASGKLFKTNDAVWSNVYSQIIKDQPELKNIFTLRKTAKKSFLYIGDAQITTFKDPTSKNNRLNANVLKPEFDFQSEQALKYFLAKVDYFKSTGDIDMAKAWLQLEMADMRTSLKLLGKVSYIEKGDFDNLVYEHISPASYLARLTMSHIVSDKLVSREQLENELQKSKVALISKATDSKLNKYAKATMGENYKYTTGVLQRYKDAGIDVGNLKPLETKEIVKESKKSASEFNKLISRATGFGTREQVSEKVAAMLGRKKGKFAFFIPPSADDFAGLMYYLVGKGKQGDADLKFIKDNLLDPFGKAMRKFDASKQKRLADFRELKRLIRKTPSRLSKKNNTGFTNEDSVRIYIWDRLGYSIPGLQKKDIEAHIKLVKGSEELLAFAQNVQGISVLGYPEPDTGWDAGSMTTDLLTYVNKTERAEYLKEWKANVDEFFTDKTINKLNAAFGENYIESLQDILYRMETGRRRAFGANKLTNSLINWVNDSVGAIMFFNTRSALLQQLSLINFINFSDNNPLSASAAFANQPQFWKDYAFLFNSDFLKQRRSGLKTDVNADEIAKAAESGENPIRSVMASILKKGFLPTQYADSHAIAIGGASFYRNRLNRYKKEGLSEKEAADKAFLDFQEIAEETQQSSRPDRISMQQASPIGRTILAFANTPMQYARLTKKAALDLINRRGDWKTNLSKLIYYGAVQNIIFSTLQSAMFAMMFDDEDDDEKAKEKYYRVANSTADSFLRGLGFGGAAIATGKNMVLEVIRQYKSGRPNYEKVALESLSLSPPIDSKISKLASAGRAFTYRQSREKMRTEGISLDNPAFEAVGQIISATTNLPADRVIRKLDNLSTPVRQDVETWQAISLALGYSKWDVGLIESQAKKPKKSTVGLKERKIKEKKLR